MGAFTDKLADLEILIYNNVTRFIAGENIQTHTKLSLKNFIVKLRRNKNGKENL